MKSSLMMLCASLLLAATSSAFAQSSDDVLYTRDTLKNANGEAIFRHICQGCHMPDAKGAVGAGAYPALAGNPKLISPQYMAAVILFGRHDMPSFETRPQSSEGFTGNVTLSDAQIADVVNYVRTHFGNHYGGTLTAEDVMAMHAGAQTKP